MKFLCTVLIAVTTMSLYGQLFSSETTFTSSVIQPQSIDVIDLDGDTDLDVLCASQGNNLLSWFENDGAGNFLGQRQIHNLAFASSVRAGDIDGDGDNDVVAATKFQDRIFTYKNNGDGTFEGAVEIYYNFFDLICDLEVADIDSDGDADIIFPTGSNIRLLRNLGDGTFAPVTTFPGVSSGSALAVGDFDNDGNLDVTAAHSSGDKIYWHQNLGGGTFAPPLNVETGVADAMDVAVADMNGDGIDDIIGSSGLLEGTAVWSLVSGSWVKTIVSSGVSVAKVTTADVDGDGIRDVVCSEFSKASWYKGLVSGGYGPATTFATGYSYITDLFAADLNGDMDVDLAYCSKSQNGLEWLPNDGMGGLNDLNQIAVSIVEPQVAAHGDFANDSFPDIIVAALYGAYMLNNVGGELQFSQFEDTYSLDDSKVADLDNDGDLDLLAGDFTVGEMIWFENVAGELSSAQVIEDNFPGIESVETIDVDGDGDLDLIGSQNNGKVFWLRKLNTGPGYSGKLLIEDYSSGSNTLYTSDLNNDGLLDLIVTYLGNNLIVWQENLGGSFGPPQSLPTSAGSNRRLALGDIDNDGDTDIMATVFTGQLIRYSNTGGSFAPVVLTTLPFTPTSLHTVDLDLDGNLDILSCSSDDKEIYWLKNLGTGSFGSPQTIGTLEEYGSSVAVDINGDGDIDIIAGLPEIGKVVSYENLTYTPCNFGPTGLAHTYAPGSLNLYWNEIPDASQYQVQISRLFGGPPVTKKFTRPINSLSIAATIPGGTVIEWMVRAACPDGPSAFSASDIIAVPSARMTESLAFPNPAQNNIRFEFGKAQQYELTVTDPLGRTVISESGDADSHNVNLSKLTPGTYFYQVLLSGKPKTTGSFIKE